MYMSIVIVQCSIETCLNTLHGVLHEATLGPDATVELVAKLYLALSLAADPKLLADTWHVGASGAMSASRAQYDSL